MKKKVCTFFLGGGESNVITKPKQNGDFLIVT